MILQQTKHRHASNSKEMSQYNHQHIITWHDAIIVLCKLVRVCNAITSPDQVVGIAATTLNRKPPHDHVNVASLALTIVDCEYLLTNLATNLLSLLRVSGRNLIQLFLQSPILAKWSHRSVLQDEIDSNHFSGNPSQLNRLQSFMAENYIKPFEDEDNRHEQRTKVSHLLFRASHPSMF
jgi:hypothetical protein